MKSLLFLTLFAFMFSCSSPVRKIANVYDNKAIVPSADQVFIKGSVHYGKRKTRPFDENHFGEEIDLSERRPAFNLAGTVYGVKFAKAGHSVIGNFYHHEKFWIVRVPDNSVNRVFVHFAYFEPVVMKKYLGGHSYLRFELKPESPVEIVARMPDEHDLKNLQDLNPEQRLDAIAPTDLNEKDRFIYNIGLTAEAQWSKTDAKKKYDFIRGEKNAFTQITRFISIHHRLWGHLSYGDPLKQVELKIEDGTKVLKTGLMVSERDALSLRYDTLGQNCTTTVFDILEAGTGLKDRRFDPLRKWFQKRIPGLAIPKTKVWGGGKLIPTIDDLSLRHEWKETYEWEMVEHQREICGPSVSAAHCQNSKNAVEKILSWPKE
jgi:hypothetical protein